MKIFNQALVIAMTAGIGAGLGSGCGGDSDSSGPADTGLPPTQLLSDVTPAEATQACERIRASFQQRFNDDSLGRAFCTLFSAASTTTPSACNSARDACIEEAMQPGSDIMMMLDTGAIDFGCEAADIGDCGDATVGDLETCFGDTLNLLDAVLNRFDCNDAGMVEADDLEGIDFAPAQSCEVVSCNGTSMPFGN